MPKREKEWPREGERAQTPTQAAFLWLLRLCYQRGDNKPARELKRIWRLPFWPRFVRFVPALLPFWCLVLGGFSSALDSQFSVLLFLPFLFPFYSSTRTEWTACSAVFLPFLVRI